jgi:hypothetical protein
MNNFFDKLTHKEQDRDQEIRDKQTQEVRSLVDDFLSEMQESIKGMQETAQPDRKDFPIASALHRSRRL